MWRSTVNPAYPHKRYECLPLFHRMLLASGKDHQASLRGSSDRLKAAQTTIQNLAKEIQQEHLVSEDRALRAATSRVLYETLAAAAKQEWPHLPSFIWRDVAVVMDRFEAVLYSLVRSALIRQSSPENCFLNRRFNLLRVADHHLKCPEARGVSPDQPTIELDQDFLVRLFARTGAKLLTDTTEKSLEQAFSKTCSLIIKRELPVFLIPGQKERATRSAVVAYLQQQERPSPLAADATYCEELREELNVLDACPLEEVHRLKRASILKFERDCRVGEASLNFPTLCNMELNVIYDPFWLSEELISNPSSHPVNLESQLAVAWVLHQSLGYVPRDREDVAELIEDTRQLVVDRLNGWEERLRQHEETELGNPKMEEFLKRHVAVYSLAVRALERRAAFVEDFLSS